MLHYIITVVLCLGYLTAVQGHLCLLSPPQRGPLAHLDVKGTDDCFQTQGPCGKLPPPAYPTIQYFNTQERNTTVVFQKNLDHYNRASPGYFSIAIGKRTASEVISFKEIARIADGPTPSLNVYTLSLPLPDETYLWYVMQVAYVTKNSQAPAAFYQCADFSVINM